MISLQTCQYAVREISSILFLRWELVMIIGLLLWLAYLALESSRAKLGHIPGPFLARYTNFHGFYMTAKFGPDADYIHKLHAKYGDVVRIGPRKVSVSDPEAIGTIYGTKNRLSKDASIQVGRPAGRALNLVTIREPEKHGQYRRTVAHAYALSTLIDYECYVDELIQTLFKAVDRYVKREQPINIARWTYFYAFDIIGYLSFGTPIGFLESGQDINGLIRAQIIVIQYLRLVMNVPYLHKLFLGNPLIDFFGLAKPQRSVFLRFTITSVQNRLSKGPNSKLNQGPHHSGKPDMLSHFIAAHEKHPSIITIPEITNCAVLNVGAGALGSSKVLEEIVRFLVSNPAAQERLFGDLRAVIDCDETFVGPMVSFKQAQDLPYLTAIIREGVRLHLSLGIVLGRDVPPSGLTLPNGVSLPPGVVVGIKPYSLASRADVFGPSPLVFNPDRWLRGEEEGMDAFQERLRHMDRGDLSFGHGARSCIGKNIAMLEIYKVIANLVWRYKMLPVSHDGPPAPRTVLAQVVRRSYRLE